MAYTQQAHPCDEHGRCTVIMCAEDETGRQVWESHAAEVIHPECRANPGHPLLAHDGRPLDSAREQCDGCRAYFSGAG